MFLYFANEDSNITSSVVPLKQYNTQSGISLEILEECPLNLAPEYTSQKKQNDTHRAIA